MDKTESKLLFFVTLVFFCIAIWKFYWKFQLMFNSSYLFLYTPEWFPIVNEKVYKIKVDSGTLYAKTQKIVIAGLLRNCRENIPTIIKRVERLGETFKDYRVLIVENDSSDGTRQALLAWAKKNSKVTILGCGRNSQRCFLRLPPTQGHSVDRKRIEKMAYLRNIYLKEVRLRFSDFDYLAVWDMDIIGSVYLDGIFNTMSYFKTEPDLTAMCAYGIYQWGPLRLYYDTYATLEKGDNFHIQTKLLHDLYKGISMQFQRGEPPVPVLSCFSGFTIYKLSALSGQYGTTPKDDPTKNLECEHVYFHRQLPGKIKMNPSMIHLVILND